MYNLELNIERICHLAKARGISINKMLKDADLSTSIIDNMKRNQRPSIDKIQTIAEYFNVSIDYLVGRTDVTEVNRRVVHKYHDEEIASAPYIAADDGGITEGRQLPLSLIKKINEEN